MCNRWDLDTKGRQRVQHGNDMDVFLRSLNNKDEKFLKGGSYHFRLPEGLEKEWDELVQQRQNEVKKEMEHFWKG